MSWKIQSPYIFEKVKHFPRHLTCTCQPAVITAPQYLRTPFAVLNPAFADQHDKYLGLWPPILRLSPVVKLYNTQIALNKLNVSPRHGRAWYLRRVKRHFARWSLLKATELFSAPFWRRRDYPRLLRQTIALKSIWRREAFDFEPPVPRDTSTS